MVIACVIAEYNPFHNGHAALLEFARRQGVTHIVAILGGNFLQRGEGALWEKRLRAEGALRSGVDLVVELPLPYSVATAQRFAAGGVALADALGCGDALLFGSECGAVEPLSQVADFLGTEAFSQALAPFLAAGETFAAARERAVAASLGEEAGALLRSPNNILAIEYLAQLRQRGSTLKAMTLARVGAGHGETAPVGAYASATHLRKCWGEDAAAASPYLPGPVFDLLRAGEGLRLDRNSFETAMFSHLRRLSPANLARLPDVTEGLENRLYTAIRAGRSTAEILELAKVKRYPLARLRRILLAGFLELPAGWSGEEPPYLRVLGYNHRGTQILARAREMATLPLSDSLARLSESGERAALWARKEAQATDLYTAALKTPIPCGYDYTAPPVRLLGKTEG